MMHNGMISNSLNVIPVSNKNKTLLVFFWQLLVLSKPIALYSFGFIRKNLPDLVKKQF